jgi:hypothetical protein
VEREGCAKGIGIAASSHLDQVIETLQAVQKREMVSFPNDWVLPMALRLLRLALCVSDHSTLDFAD